MIDLRNHYGFTRTPFGKDLTPSMLHHYPAHAECSATFSVSVVASGTLSVCAT